LEHLFALREARTFVIDPTQLAGVATFPSFHTALALMTAAAWRDVPTIRAAMFAWQALVIVSTIPIGGHYVVDLIAGAACWGVAHILWRKAQAISAEKPQVEDVAPAYA
jgi:membrane-associated phospholipid phosphatase